MENKMSLEEFHEEYNCEKCEGHPDNLLSDLSEVIQGLLPESFSDEIVKFNEYLNGINVDQQNAGFRFCLYLIKKNLREAGLEVK